MVGYAKKSIKSSYIGIYGEIEGNETELSAFDT
jgi:hypothetical protein